jgi:release factor glutamine methyltransferase
MATGDFTGKYQSPLGRWIFQASKRLADSGHAAPRFDAERLAAHVLGVSWSDLWIDEMSKPLDGTTTAALDAVLRRRLAGEPLAYIQGSRVFYGLELECGPGVLVPRPETETLVDVGLELIAGITTPVVVDIGTGSGAIALAIASKRTDAEVIATDVSEEALAFARRNGASLGIDVWFAAGDLFEAVPDEVRGRVDLLVSNPPYVPEGAGVPTDVRSEPSVAVFGGEIGNDVLERIVAAAPQWLRPGGALAMEIGEGYQADVLPGAEVRKDHTDRPRVIWRRF